MQRSQMSNNWRTPNPTPPTKPPPAAARRSTVAIPDSGKRVYVGNLLYTVRKQDIEEFFNVNGVPFEFVEMSTDPFTGRNPGYCFVELRNVSDVEHAINTLNGLEIASRPVKVNLVTPKASASTASTSRTTTYDRAQPRYFERPEGEQTEARVVPRTFDRWDRQTNPQDRWTNITEQGKRLYVGGLPRLAPQAYATEILENMFQGFNVEAVSKIISPHESKQTPDEPGNHYYAFVDFATSDDAAAAKTAVDGTMGVWGGPVRVNFAKNAGSKKLMKEQLPRGFGREEGDHLA